MTSFLCCCCILSEHYLTRFLKAYKHSVIEPSSVVRKGEHPSQEGRRREAFTVQSNRNARERNADT